MARVAFFIDGGFLLKRIRTVSPGTDADDPAAVARCVQQLVERHLQVLAQNHACRTPWELLYRAFYYDAVPLSTKGHRPVSKRAIDWARTPQARFRHALFDRLRAAPNFAVRLGETHAERQWVLKDEAQKRLLDGALAWSDVTDDDFDSGVRQKAVDMRLGVDIASVTLKRQADTIVLVTGDRDFVPAAKLARREGVRVILDPLWLTVKGDLHEHIDALRSAFADPSRVVRPRIDP